MKELFKEQEFYPERMRVNLFIVSESSKKALNSAEDWKPHDVVDMVAPKRSQHELKEKADLIIKNYRHEISLAGDDEQQKIRCIAKCAQQLEQSHLFDDGNARTIGFLAVNKLLLENKMDPTMISNPNKFDGLSVDELSEEIRDGQSIFRNWLNNR